VCASNKWPHQTATPHVSSSSPRFPSRCRTLCTLLGSDGGPVYAANTLPPTVHPSVYDTKLSGLSSDVASIPEPKSMGYAFDDGPNCKHNIFYNCLSIQKRKATMFDIGSSIVDWPLEAQCAITDGHEICAHTWSHRYTPSRAKTHSLSFGTRYKPSNSSPASHRHAGVLPMAMLICVPHFPGSSNIAMLTYFGIGPHSLYCESTGPADYHLEV